MHRRAPELEGLRTKRSLATVIPIHFGCISEWVKGRPRKKPVRPMTWRRYEAALLEKLRAEFPANFFDVRPIKVRGKTSRVLRQLDVAIFRRGTPDVLYLVADAKRHTRRLDVKVVEQFIGMLGDLGVGGGILASPYGGSSAALRRADAARVQVRILTYEEALAWDWMPFARSLYPSDPAFHPAMAFALRALDRGDATGFVDAMEDGVPFEEWKSVVEGAPRHLRPFMIDALTTIACCHSDDGWRFNAIRQLNDTYEALTSALVAELLAREADPDVLELLYSL